MLLASRPDVPLNLKRDDVPLLGEDVPLASRPDVVQPQEKQQEDALQEPEQGGRP